MEQERYSELEQPSENIEQQKRARGIEKQLEDISVDETIIALETIASVNNVSILSAIYDKAKDSTKSILGAVVFALMSQGALAQKVESVENSDSSYEAHQTFKKDLQRMTGLPILDEAHKIQRHVTLLKAQKETPMTIIHIGQSHKTKPEVNFRFRKEIVQSQKEIAEFLAATTTPVTKVFVEGWTKESMRFFQEDKAALQSFQTINSFEKLKSEYIRLWKTTPTNVAQLNRVIGDKLVDMGFSEVSPLVYSKGTEVFALYGTGVFPIAKNYVETNHDETLMAGAPVLLGAQDKITIEAAETSEGNSKPRILAEKLKEKGKELGKLFVSFDPSNTYYQYLGTDNLPNIGTYSAKSIQELSQDESCKKSISCQKIASEILTEHIPAVERAILDDREDIAVELIAKSARGKQKVFPLVYGSAHDFTKAVLRWNSKHPTMQFNLVTVKSCTNR